MVTEVMDYPPCSPDFLVGVFNKYFAGERFATGAKVKQAVNLCFAALDANFSYAGIQALVPRRDERSIVNGD